MLTPLLKVVSVLVLCLLALQTWALSGPETAQLLNQRLLATPEQCVDDSPTYNCSGVLLLPMSDSHPRPFWYHDEEAHARGAERFHFLRADVDSGPISSAFGYVLHDGFSAYGLRKPYTVVDGDTPDSGERLVRNWPEDAPGQLAVQALFYDHTRPDALLRAQQGQLDYFQATGDWLPLVRFAFSRSQGRFGFDQSVQLYNGYQIAARLNARYARTEAACDGGAAAYNCNGVLLRTTDVGSFHAWDPSPASQDGNGVSFMYFRADITTRLYKPQGFVVRELSYPVREPMTLRCIFPYDAGTGGAVDYCNFRPSCKSLGITTVAAWSAKYQRTPTSSCFFDSTAADYQLALDVRNQSGARDPYGWPELIMAAWPTGAGERLPLEAFVHQPGAPAGARTFQRDYLLTHKRYLPVLEVIANPADGQVFTYDPAEQSIP